MNLRVDLYRLKAQGVYIPWYYRFSYDEIDIVVRVYYPIPINYIVRYGRSLCNSFLRILYWIGLIDVGPGEVFLWTDFYRIKSH